MPTINYYDPYNVASAAAAAAKYNGIQSTPTTSTTEVATATIVLILVAVIIGVLLVYWATEFGMMFFFYSLDPKNRPRNIYESNENNCKDLCCIYINRGIIKSCCPSVLALKEGETEEAQLFIKPDANTTKLDIVHTNSRFMPPTTTNYNNMLAPIPEYELEERMPLKEEDERARLIEIVGNHHHHHHDGRSNHNNSRRASLFFMHYTR